MTLHGVCHCGKGQGGREKARQKGVCLQPHYMRRESFGRVVVRWLVSLLTTSGKQRFGLAQGRE